jgi:hypothetical protein
VQPLSSKTAHPGDRLELELAKDLRVNDLLVAREGTRAGGEVSVAEKAGMMGKAGDLAIRLTDLRIGDARVKLRGTQGKAGNSKIGTTVALSVAFGPLGLMKHGKNAELPSGTAITAYVAEDVSVASLSPRPALVEPPPPPAPPVVQQAAATQSAVPLQLLDTPAILQMKAGGLSDDLIVAMAVKRGLASIAPEDLIKMKAAGISNDALSKLVELGMRQ